MTDFPDSSRLSASEHEQLAAQKKKFEEACQRLRTAGQAASLDDYLPPEEEALRVATLWRLIPTDLRQRWGRGERAMLEEYVARYPELGGVSQLPIALLHEEYSVRSQFVGTPPLREYEQRFPRQFAQFRQLVESAPIGPGTLQVPRDEVGASSMPTIEAPPGVPVVAEDSSNAREADTDRDEQTETERWEERSPGTGEGRPAESPAAVRTVGGGRYRLMQLLGCGQYGEVWLAEATGGVLVAVKIIRFSMRNQMTQQELRSLELMKQLKHPFLLEVHAYWEEDDQLMIVTTLADKTLADRLKECQEAGLPGIPAEELLGYVSGAAEAIDFLHERKVVHRDIKPANILLVDKYARVGDFGLARVLEGNLIRATTIGTPLYMPPESFEGRASKHGDQYSLAVTYVELRRGRAPFEAETVPAIMRSVLTDPPDLSGLDPAEQQVLKKALSKDPNDRYESSKEFSQALKDSLFPPPPLPSASSSRRQILLLLGVISIAICTWFVWHGRSSLPDASSSEPLVPDGFIPAPSAKQVFSTVNNCNFYDRIMKEVDSGIRVEFQLICGDDRLPTFYIMRHKVWNELFSVFARDVPEQLDSNTQWMNGWWTSNQDDHDVLDYPDHPVFRVTHDEAERFAQWIGGSDGRLPTRKQWDRAAGKEKWDEAQNEEVTGLNEYPPGPYRPELWTANREEGIGIANGPLPVHREGTADISPSPFEVYDMAGNGLEWTDDRYESTRPPWNTYFYVRGRGHSQEKEPLRYDFDEWEGQAFQGSEARPDVSFRVVISAPLKPTDDDLAE